MIICFPAAAGGVRKLIIGLTPEDIGHLMLGTPERIEMPAAELPAGGSCDITVIFGCTAKDVNDEMVLGIGVPPSLIPQDRDVPAGQRG